MTPITPEWLRKIADEVEKYPARWTKEAMARNELGSVVRAKSDEAKCWCFVGFRVRDGIEPISDFNHYTAVTGKNDNLNSPAEFVAWLLEMAKELEVRS